MPLAELLNAVQRQLQRGRRPTCKLNRTDGKLTLDQVKTLDNLLDALSRMSDRVYLLRIHVNDQTVVQDFIESWGGAHASRRSVRLQSWASSIRSSVLPLVMLTICTSRWRGRC